MGEGHGPAGLTEEEWLEQPRQAWEQTANRALKDMRRSDVRRHVTLPQSWIQRENWEFETHTVSWQMSMPRSHRRSSTCLSEKG